MLSRKLILTLLIFALSTVVKAQSGRWETKLSGGNWNLWIDRGATFFNDDLYLPPVNVSKLPVNPPTIGWDKLHQPSTTKIVAVPGTVEEHYWGAIGGAIQDTAGNYVGVSWWSRKFRLDDALKGKRITLYFQSVNLRAEVFVNGKLVGYDVVGNTPFEVDATSAVLFGKENQLDVRITDPVGNFSWDDNGLMLWGKNFIPAVHGFGGITGEVILRATDAVKVSDIYVQNQPNPKMVNVIVTLNNSTGSAQSGQLNVSIHEKGNPRSVVWSKTIPASVMGTAQVFTISATVPQAKLWELSEFKDEKKATLYEATVKYTSNDRKIVDNATQRFGFRWFDVGEKDNDKRFYLNGKRVFLMAAMTRGFWPKNGIFPTPEMAKRDMNMLTDLGLNTMLMHRAIGQPGVFDYADAAGLFTYEEPGGYRVTANRRDRISGPDEQAFKLRSIKLERMILRDRSLPSLIIYNLKNEETAPPTDNDKKDMIMAHKLDPSRIITWNSDEANGKDPYKVTPNDPFELHMRPYNPNLIYGGWWDQHHWYGYSGYTDEMYRNPKFYLRGTINAARNPLPKDSLYALDKSKVIFYGEEGAFGAMVRLQKIKEEVEKNPSGFRELEHIDWFNAYNKFLDESGFRKSYPDVDSLTRSLGRNLHYFHGRNLENIRMSNIADAYNMNGWGSASTRTDVVDAYRNPTADASIISYYTRPLYVAVKLRNKVVSVGVAPIADFYIINQKGLKGKHNLRMVVYDTKGKEVVISNFPVNVAGGETFGEILVENVKLPAVKEQGYYRVQVTLDAAGAKKADGYDEIYAVDLNDNTQVNSSIMVLESNGSVKDFLKATKGVNALPYNPTEKASVIVVGTNTAGSITPAIMSDLIKRVQDGAKLVVLENADLFAGQVHGVLRGRPGLVTGTGIANLGNGGRLFVGQSSYLNGLPQSQGMSWEYQTFYKGVNMGDNAQVAGLRLNTWGSELIVALGNQGSKEILSALTRVPVGQGEVFLSTLNIVKNLPGNEQIDVVAKKLLLNLLK